MQRVNASSSGYSFYLFSVQGVEPGRESISRSFCEGHPLASYDGGVHQVNFENMGEPTTVPIIVHTLANIFFIQEN